MSTSLFDEEKTLQQRDKIVTNCKKRAFCALFSFSCCQFFRPAQLRLRASCRCDGPAPPESGSKKFQTGARAGAKPTLHPNPRARAARARKPAAEPEAVPSPHP